jgi:SAM-dependent methyltransferase
VGELLNIITPLHRVTRRNYLDRMIDNKVEAMGVAKRYDLDYWDGERRYGYGGYHYDGRWRPVAQRLIDHYQLAEDARILDVGCGKAHLLYELAELLPHAELIGMDASAYAIGHAKAEIRERLRLGRAEDPYPWGDDHFDLVISLTTLHNLRLPALTTALGEMNRVGRCNYLVVESFRNDQELFNLQCWALTCATFLEPDEWRWLFERCGFGGDHEFIFFE